MSSTSKLSAWLVSPGLGEFNRAEALRKVVDPETTPFKSRYEAIEIYEKLIKDLESFSDSEPSDRLWLLQFALQSESSFLHMDTEDLSSAERCLRACIELVRSKLKLQFIVSQFNANDETSGEEKVTDPEAKPIPPELSLLIIQLYNQLGYLKSMKLNFQGAVPFLQEAERIFYVW